MSDKNNTVGSVNTEAASKVPITQQLREKYGLPPSIPSLPSADQDLFSYFNLYPHIIDGKFYRQNDEPLKMGIKVKRTEIPGMEIKPTLDQYGCNTDVIQDENSIILRKGAHKSYLIDEVKPDLTVTAVPQELKESVQRFTSRGPPLGLLPKAKREKKDKRPAK